MERRYFDANASAPPCAEAVEAVSWALRQAWGNPTSPHREGQRARHLLEEARSALAANLGVHAAELVFCASATEALHLLLRGLRPGLGDRPVAVFPGEHSACLNPLRDWNAVHWLPELPEGCALMVQMAASNETGILYPLPQPPGALRVKDCAQAWGKVPVDLSDCDAAVFSAHKMGGPRGAGLLWMRPGLPWTALLEGPQERGRRGGTEDLPAVLGMAAAGRQAAAREEANRALGPLRDAFEAELLDLDLGVRVVGRDRPRLPNTSCLLLDGRLGEDVMMALDLDGFAVSTGSACHSGATRPSHALTTLGFSEAEARSAIRVSLLPGTAEADLAALAAALRRILALRARARPAPAPPAGGPVPPR